MSVKGVWLDTKTGRVVEVQPEEGVQLVAPGVPPTPDEQARLDAYRAAAKSTVTVEVKPEMKTVK